MIKAIDGRTAQSVKALAMSMTDCTCVCQVKGDQAQTLSSVFADPGKG